MQGTNSSVDIVYRNKVLMVAMELVMTLFALLYAFPHIPDRILDDEEDDVAAQWFSVQSSPAFRAAVENLLQTSDVLQASLLPPLKPDDLTSEVVTNVRRLSDTFGLCLTSHHVPSTCRQMYESIVSMYQILLSTDIGTRDDLHFMFTKYQFVSTKHRLPGLSKEASEDRAALIRFCSERTVAWMQPYFVRDQRFYLPNQVCN